MAEELFCKPIRPPDHLGGYARLGERVCRHHLHAEPRGPDGNGREFHQTREHTTIETQGGREAPDSLWSQEHRYKRSRFAEALNSLTSDRFAQKLNDAAQVLPQHFAF
jgi:hypothetical protein